MALEKTNFFYDSIADLVSLLCFWTGRKKTPHNNEVCVWKRSHRKWLPPFEYPQENYTYL